jgi:hypothetical protein
VEDEPLVTAKVIAGEFGIPRSTLYRLVDDGKVRAHDVTADYHQRRQFRFLVSEVRADLDKIKEQRTPPPA